MTSGPGIMVFVVRLLYGRCFDKRQSAKQIAPMRLYLRDFMVYFSLSSLAFCVC